MLCRTLQGHGHWVNTMTLSTDYVLRTAAYDPANASLVHQDTEDSGKSLLQLEYVECLRNVRGIAVVVFCLNIVFSF